MPAPAGEQALAGILAKRGWWREVGLRKTAEPVLLRLCAHYLWSKPAMASQAGARPVAHFHLSNGAQGGWNASPRLATRRKREPREGATLQMVNYLYDPDEDRGTRHRGLCRRGEAQCVHHGAEAGARFGVKFRRG